MPSESEIISRIKRRVQKQDGVIVGIGDDAAVVRTSSGKDLIACCDLMVEGVHFRREWAPAKLIGRKALAVTLSDIAAMGALARFAMISVALPSDCSSEFVDELFEGVCELADSCGVSVIGGDTSSSRDSLFLDTTVIGECESGKAITRRGANVGDRIYVSGSLGASALGLSLLEGGFRLDESQDINDGRGQAVLKHLSPEPKLKLGRAIGERGFATAMIDISDGLSTDLWHILDESGVGALIDASAIPIAECLAAVASGAPGIDPLHLALHGGEEYELLFTVRSENHKQVMALAETLSANITTFGEIVAFRQLQLEHDGGLRSVCPLGHEHQI